MTEHDAVRAVSVARRVIAQRGDDDPNPVKVKTLGNLLAAHDRLAEHYEAAEDEVTELREENGMLRALLLRYEALYDPSPEEIAS
jgi:hypothetical protein